MPLQATPLRVKAVGFGLLPEYAPLNPMVVEAPVPRLPFHDSLVAVTSLPVWLHFADQPWVTRWELFGKENLSVQPVSASPRFLTVTLAVKPAFQSLVA